jgi:deazaflavin-dependent oxidoreductase (nitroreductase family)
MIDHDLDRLAAITTVDLTTFGRTTGLPRRVEIWWFRVEGRFVVTGMPGRRDWLANAIANPDVIVHVDGRDLRARAAIVTDDDFRRRVFTRPATRWYSTMEELDRLVQTAPMIELHLDL